MRHTAHTHLAPRHICHEITHLNLNYLRKLTVKGCQVFHKQLRKPCLYAERHCKLEGLLARQLALHLFRQVLLSLLVQIVLDAGAVRCSGSE